MNARARLLLVATAAAVIVGCARAESTQTTSTAADSPHIYAPRPLRTLVVARTPDRVERGRYLTEGLLQCFLCHSERDWKKPGAPPIPALKGAGAVWPGRPWLVAPNLTPDNETGTGTWTDDMLIRAIREGISHDGRVLNQQMWYAAFRTLPDEDVEAVVAYLRSLKPIRNPLPSTHTPADRVKELAVPEPITEPVPPMAPASDVERGRLLAHLADCSGCHTSWYTPKNPGLFGGGNLIERGSVTALSANITTDDSGISYYDAALFREAIRSGKVKARELRPLMPWIVFRNLSDEDLNALFAYLRALPKVKHLINNVDNPTTCRICGGKHPLGEYNRPPELKPISVPVAALKDVAGTYRFEDNFTFRVAIEGSKLMLKFDKDGCELVTEDRRTFFCEGDIDRIEFVRDAGGQVTGLISNLDPAVKIR